MSDATGEREEGKDPENHFTEEQITQLRARSLIRSTSIKNAGSNSGTGVTALSSNRARLVPPVLCARSAVASLETGNNQIFLSASPPPGVPVQAVHSEAGKEGSRT